MEESKRHRTPDEWAGIRENEERLWTMIEAAQDGFITVDAEGRIVSANTSAYNLLGAEYGGLSGRKLNELLPGSCHPDLEAGLQVKCEWCLPVSGAADRRVEVTLSPHMTRSGRYFSMVLRDVTDRFMAQKQLMESHEKLRVAHEELKRTQDHLVSTERLAALGELAMGVAHEVNNPLQGFKGRLQLMAEDLSERLGPESPALADLKLLDEQVDRLSKIVRGLLAFARPLKVESALVDINETVGTVVQLMESSVRSSGLRLECEMASGLSHVEVDVSQIQQVILNLLQNATQATDPGGCIRVRTFGVDSSVAIEVQDTGCGIRPEDLVRVFEPFFTTKVKGSGLGLSICRGIVTQHGGKLKIESEVDRGTKVQVLLPVGG